MLFPCTSASFCRFLLALSHSFLMPRFSKFKLSGSTSDQESFKTSFTALTTRVFGSWPLCGRFLAPWNRTRPAPQPHTVNQVDFMPLDCACISLQKIISFPVSCRGHTARFLILVLVFLLASSSESFAAWCGPLLCTYLADW